MTAQPIAEPEGGPGNLPPWLFDVGRQWVLANVAGADAMALSRCTVQALIEGHYVTGVAGFVRDTRR